MRLQVTQPAWALLGAEKQTATSIALAYPELRFVFVTDQPVIDGWELPNVDIRRGVLSEVPVLAGQFGRSTIALCGRWLEPALELPANNLGRFDLASVMAHLESRYPERVCPVHSRPAGPGYWIAKGDLRHRPDAVVSGRADELTTTEDPHQCGIVFQRIVSAAEPYIATGFRGGHGAADIAVFAVYGEVHCRENLLTAGETVNARDLVEASLLMLDSLDHRGWFSMKWLRTADGLRLSSLRPHPCAVFQTMRRGGLDTLCNELREVRVASDGLRFVADNCYTSYGTLP
jgi:hypothetical protein